MIKLHCRSVPHAGAVVFPCVCAGPRKWFRRTGKCFAAATAVKSVHGFMREMKVRKRGFGRSQHLSAASCGARRRSRKAPRFSTRVSQAKFLKPKLSTHVAQVKANAIRLEHSSARPAAVSARKLSETRSWLRMIHPPISILSGPIKSFRTSPIHCSVSERYCPRPSGREHTFESVGQENAQTQETHYRSHCLEHCKHPSRPAREKTPVRPCTVKRIPGRRRTFPKGWGFPATDVSKGSTTTPTWLGESTACAANH